jgi:hypothetical protein
MTEAEWMACTDPRSMLEFLRGTTTDRKLRLFLTACCRQIWHLLPDPRFRDAVEVAERYADGGVVTSSLIEAGDRGFVPSNWGDNDPMDWTLATPSIAIDLTNPGTWVWVVSRPPDELGSIVMRVWWIRGGLRGIPGTTQSDLLRDLFGPLPFRPVTVHPDVLAWNDRLVVRLAQAIYDGMRWGDIPILADALLDAGCDDENLIAHCRSEGPHVRGCWAIDLILGKR